VVRDWRSCEKAAQDQGDVLIGFVYELLNRLVFHARSPLNRAPAGGALAGQVFSLEPLEISQ
jgi:hypothetical protein